MTKRISKLLSMLLVAVMMLSMAMTGLAAEIEPMSSTTDTTFSITVTNAADGETYNAYKIFDVTYSDEDTDGNINYSYTIDSGSAWYSTVAAADDVFTLTQIGESSTYVVTLASDEITDDEIIAVFTNADIDLSQVTADATAEASSGQAVLDVTTSGPGYYYVTTTLGSLVIIDTTNPSVRIEEKNGQPTTKKYVDENDEQESIDNETTVEYEIQVPNIKGVLNLVIEDAMNIYVEGDDVGNTVDDNIDYSFDYDGLTVTLVDGDAKTQLTIEEDYILIIPDKDEDADRLEDGCDFHIIFTVDDVNYDFSNCSSEAYIEVKVSCTIYAEGYDFSSDEIEIPNNARVTYGDVSKSEWDEADVYEYGFEIFKYAGDIEDEPDALANAEFQLSRTADGGSTEYATFQQNSNGQYVLTGWDDDPDAEGTTIVSAETGYIYVEGLAAGEYILTETKAPDGYNQLTSSLTITITVGNDPNEFTVSVDGTDLSDHIVKVLNNAGALLPGTGGMGTTLFYVIGVVLILGAAVLFVTKKRLDKE